MTAWPGRPAAATPGPAASSMARSVAAADIRVAPPPSGRTKPGLDRSVEAVAKHGGGHERPDQADRPQDPANAGRPRLLSKGVEQAEPDDAAHLIREEHRERH